jgi:hypothetical protein
MRQRKLLILITVLLSLIIVPLAQAQDVEPIDFGDTVRGRITDPDEGDLYTFEGREGETISVELFSDDTDVYLRLADADGNVIVENDDISRSNLNAAIEYELEEDGTYFIAALAYDPGSYTLVLYAEEESSGSNQSSGDGPIELNYGDNTSGQAISLDTPIVYYFNGQAGDTVSITLASDAVDVYLVLTDSNGNELAENDDISQSNLNSFIETVLPANGTYLVGVFAYDAGPYELSLEAGSTGTVPVSEPSQEQQDVITGEITDRDYFLQFPLEDIAEGSTISIEVNATSGDLDTYVGLFQGDTVIAENDDGVQGSTNSVLEYPNAEAGDFTIVVTRYGFEEGRTEGEFEMFVKVSSASSTSVVATGDVEVDPVASGYPAMTPTSNIAEWTVLVYMGGDNNLEAGLENDLNEFEIAGGSTDDVRILTLFDRSGEYSRANDNWTDVRLFEPGRDRSRDHTVTYPPTIDTEEMARLGELDTSYGQNLLDFIVWGVQSFPAQRYAIILNDHGGAWQGIVTDDTTGQGILEIPELAQVFDAALKATGVERFDLLINDACLMSSVEYYAEMARFFDYSLSSPEITLNPSFDMTLFTEALNNDPNIDMDELGERMVDKYLQDMGSLSPDTVPVLGAAMTDLRNFDSVTTALDQWVEVVGSNLDAYVSDIGRARANTYAYSFFLPEDQYGPATNIDLGNFMFRLADLTNDDNLQDASRNVLSALRDVVLYGAAGRQLEGETTYYNIYFPERATDFIPGYTQYTPLQNWGLMLRAFFGGVSPQQRTFRAPALGTLDAPAAAPSSVPTVSVTNVYPAVISVNEPVSVSMEVTGRNISQGNFTIDYIQDDGTLLRLRTARIVTQIVDEEGFFQFINFWAPGVDDSDFTWEVELPVVTDGETTSYEQVVTQDSISTIAGRYRFPGEEDWQEATVIFDSDGNAESIVTSQSGAFAPLRVVPGGEFQTYNAFVTPDGRVETQPGTTFIWPEGGISWENQPAPTGRYNLGFLVEAVGGVTGFDSVEVEVDESDADFSLRGYTNINIGFSFQRPEDWFRVNYVRENAFYQTSNLEETEFLFAYLIFETDGGDLESIAQASLDIFGLEMDRRTDEIEVQGLDALEFTTTYVNNDVEFQQRSFAVYLEDIDVGIVFSAEATTEDAVDRLYDLLLETVTFFDANEVAANDTGFWASDFYSASDYPVPETWMPGGDDGLFWYYHPDDDTNNPVFAAVTALTNEDLDNTGALELLIEDELEDLDDYEQGDIVTYYGENHTWEAVNFTFTNQDNIEMRGQLYVTVFEGQPYAIWFGAPIEEYNQLFNDIFTVMLDGFLIEIVEES